MLEIKVTIEAADIAAAINNLAAAIDGKNVKPVTSDPVTPTAPVNPTPAPELQPIADPAITPTTVDAAPVNPTMPALGAHSIATPAQTATPIVPSVPAAPVVTPATNTASAPAVPTSVPQYTLEMIATAGSALIDAGKMDQLMDLLGKYGVATLTDLNPSQYGALALDLRALGAHI